MAKVRRRSNERREQLSRQRYIVVLVLGIALAAGGSTLDLGSGLITLGLILALFGGVALLWDAVRSRRGV